eukprot:TRINITY_DN56186_c0_g1_i1.p1 TRINITY_DN56186_c0_g1~~TRINITY_DN56186_c0_g1_i1.p1  ORF type:complete len:119 (+),score=20.78 TRINITY_DN56186_c0_g1_i1:322-678(+)
MPSTCPLALWVPTDTWLTPSRPVPPTTPWVPLVGPKAEVGVATSVSVVRRSTTLLVTPATPRPLRTTTPTKAVPVSGVCRGRIFYCCLLYTSDAADEEDSVDLGGRRIIKKKKITECC